MVDWQEKFGENTIVKEGTQIAYDQIVFWRIDHAMRTMVKTPFDVSEFARCVRSVKVTLCHVYSEEHDGKIKELTKQLGIEKQKYSRGNKEITKPKLWHDALYEYSTAVLELLIKKAEDAGYMPPKSIDIDLGTS